jgi:hypothetical protein
MLTKHVVRDSVRLLPHDLHQTFVGKILACGVDIVGHASVKTIRSYDRRPEIVKQHAVNRLYFPYTSVQ